MLRLWERWRLTAAWPAKGGPAEQTPRVVDAFALLSKTLSALEPKR
jgi:hypothetical protein